ncbi:MAG: hypothetical protein K6E15_03450 [Prevotella sp.]|nr:hypothetical protein [Prevotella sp.]
MKKNLLLMLSTIWPLVLTMIFSCTMALASCSDNKDNSGTPAPEPAPTEELADYTLFIYGHSGGHMDDIIEGVYEEVKPLLDKQKKVRVLFSINMAIKRILTHSQAGMPTRTRCCVSN